MGFKVSVIGLDAVLRDIERYTEEVKENVKKAVKESAINIEGHAKQKTPVDTGNLKRSITHKAINDGFSAEIGTYDVKYAPYIEYGSSRNPAQPYLRPSLEEETANFKELIEKAVKEAR